MIIHNGGAGKERSMSVEKFLNHLRESANIIKFFPTCEQGFIGIQTLGRCRASYTARFSEAEWRAFKSRLKATGRGSYYLYREPYRTGRQKRREQWY